MNNESPDTTESREDNPARLRECLEALARASGLSVNRLEVDIRRDGGVTIIVTSSNQGSEKPIADAMAQVVRAHLDKLCARDESTAAPLNAAIRMSEAYVHMRMKEDAGTDEELCDAREKLHAAHEAFTSALDELEDT